jgi:hypothetical protein
MYCPGWVEIRIPAERMRRPSRTKRSAKTSHHGSVLAGCDPNGIRFDVRRKICIPRLRFQRRIASRAPRFASTSSAIRSSVTFASRAVRAGEVSYVFTQA